MDIEDREVIDHCSVLLGASVMLYGFVRRKFRPEGDLMFRIEILQICRDIQQELDEMRSCIESEMEDPSSEGSGSI